ncbi:ABC transporter ATP-binding protein [Bacillaceae bacterium IKA-2]|nr:ABC transporter ATP-binding protein [Bacillaceae bacterium IKA-2]
MALEINGLTVGYETGKGIVKAVRKANLQVKKGQIVGLVGESGCGKSSFLFSIIGLLGKSGKLIEGNILFNGKDQVKNSNEQWRKIRGRDISMIFQDPMTTLNPAYSVGHQIREVLINHCIVKPEIKGWFRRLGLKKEEVKRVHSLMAEVGIPSPEKRYNDYPHQFSGGMQQRMLIAMALASEPELILADEPTTALDVTIQNQILDLLKKINRERSTSIILVTHDLAVASEFCDEITVMYAGVIVEQGVTEDVIKNPKHPYTQGLFKSIPRITNEKEKIEPIPGSVIDLFELGDDCPYYSRCPHANPSCLRPIEMTDLGNHHQVRCVLYEKGSEVQ